MLNAVFAEITMKMVKMRHLTDKHAVYLQTTMKKINQGLKRKKYLLVKIAFHRYN